jgi:hypothetical protein
MMQGLRITTGYMSQLLTARVVRNYIWICGAHTSLLLEATNFLRCITAFSSIDLPALARPVGGWVSMPQRQRIGFGVKMSSHPSFAPSSHTKKCHARSLAEPWKEVEMVTLLKSAMTYDRDRCSLHAHCESRPQIMTSAFKTSPELSDSLARSARH